MHQSQRTSLRVFVGVEIGCFLVLVAGVVTACSPLWTPGGLFGWWHGYRLEEDVMGILWLTGSLLSFFVGIIVVCIAAATDISIGVATGIVGMASNRALREQLKFAAINDLGDAASDKSSTEG